MSKLNWNKLKLQRPPDKYEFYVGIGLTIYGDNNMSHYFEYKQR